MDDKARSRMTAVTTMSRSPTASAVIQYSGLVMSETTVSP